MDLPLVSICIPTYNNAGYIKETLDSLLVQTYANINIIVGDNASSDGTEAIVRKMMESDKRITYVRHHENLGYVGNLNKLLELATSEYVAFYHSDDVYEPSIVERQMAILLGSSDIAAVFAKMKRFHEKDIHRAVPLPFSFLESSELNRGEGYVWGGMPAYLPLIMGKGNPFVCPTFICRKEVFNKSGLWSDKYIGSEDLYLWLRILHCGCNVAIILDYLINYRLHSASGTSTLKSDTRSLIIDNEMRLVDDFIAEVPELVTGKMLKSYRKKNAKEILNIANECLAQGDRQKFKQYCRLSRNMYHFPLFSKRFFMQWLPGAF